MNRSMQILARAQYYHRPEIDDIFLATINTTRRQHQYIIDTHSYHCELAGLIAYDRRDYKLRATRAGHQALQRLVVQSPLRQQRHRPPRYCPTHPSVHHRFQLLQRLPPRWPAHRPGIPADHPAIQRNPLRSRLPDHPRHPVRPKRHPRTRPTTRNPTNTKRTQRRQIQP